MDNEMERLIIVPQFPTQMRYQGWWWSEFPFQFGFRFKKVIMLGENSKMIHSKADRGLFAPVQQAIEFELEQIKEYMALDLRDNDVLLLNDLSFPGLFANILFHRRPRRCFAICHATSRNAYDYFAKDRTAKYPVEKATAKLFNKVFVGSHYHAQKLKWRNIEVAYLPFPPIKGIVRNKLYNIVSVARKCVQKQNNRLISQISTALNTEVKHADAKTWGSYYDLLSKTKVMLITSKEETFGYQVIDAIKNNCIPIAPNKFSYPELLSQKYLYNSTEEAIAKVSMALNGDNYPVVGKLPVPVLQIPDQFFFKVMFHIAQSFK